MIEFLSWVEVNKKKLLIGAAVLAVAIGAYAIYQWHRNEAEVDAVAALYKIQSPAGRPAGGGLPGAQAYLAVATSHSGTSAGAQALLMGGAGLFRENKFADAKTQFESFLRTYPEHPMAPTAAFGVAASLDAMDKTNEALTAYQDVVSRYPGSAVATQAKLGLARLYEAKNDFTQAFRIYEELSRPTAFSAWSPEAAARRDRLLARHPELAKTNAPAPVVSSALSNVLGTNPPLLELPPSNSPPAKPPGP
jgi:outer membrane protein assembly factor BamD (BamD/ComL family)